MKYSKLSAVSLAALSLAAQQAKAQEAGPASSPKVIVVGVAPPSYKTGAVTETISNYYGTHRTVSETDISIPQSKTAFYSSVDKAVEAVPGASDVCIIGYPGILPSTHNMVATPIAAVIVPMGPYVVPDRDAAIASIMSNQSNYNQFMDGQLIKQCGIIPALVPAVSGQGQEPSQNAIHNLNKVKPEVSLRVPTTVVEAPLQNEGPYLLRPVTTVTARPLAPKGQGPSF